MTDYSRHDESVDTPTMYEQNERKAGTRGTMNRGASLSDMSDRGSTRAPLTEAMPVSPQGEMARGSYD